MTVCSDVVFQPAEEYFVSQEKPISGAEAQGVFKRFGGASKLVFSPFLALRSHFPPAVVARVAAPKGASLRDGNGLKA
jgi:hypothetical protein